MKYSHLLILLLIIAVAIPVKAQETRLFDTNELGQVVLGDVMRTFQSREVKGTPYLSNEWVQGHIIINENANTESIYLRFNSYQNRVEFARDQNAYAVDSKKIDGFVLYASDGRIIFRNGFTSDKHDIEPSTLLRVIQDGNTKFLCHHKTTLKEDLPTYGSATKKDEFVSNQNFYIVDSDGTFHEIKKLKAKHVLGILDDKKKEIKEFVRTNNLDYSKESDIARIVAFYNKQQAS
ncbi:MAG: hypothetical protein R3211_06295 [Balneolaceae bacterium]|nr:hypothetical protein [Balneolaceae bacterium]